MVFQPADVPVLLEDFGVDIVLGEETVKGILDRNDEEILDSGAPSPITGQGVVITVASGTPIGVDEGVTITADGASYKVRQIMTFADGAYSRLFCEIV